MQLRERKRAPLASAGERMNAGVERYQRLGKVTRIDGDTGFADSQHRMLPVVARQRRAARLRIAPVAFRKAGLAVVGAARALQHIAAKPRHIADLLRSAKIKRLGNHRTGGLDLGMRGQVGHAHHGTEPDGLGGHLDGLQLRHVEPRHVYQVAGTQHIQLHQIEHRGAARNEQGLRLERGSYGLCVDFHANLTHRGLIFNGFCDSLWA